MYELHSIEVPSDGIMIMREGKKVLEILSVGATLNHLSLLDRDFLIDGYSKNEIDSFAWCKSGILFPFPNRLRDGRYSFEGKSYQFPINEEANHNALHGFVHKSNFELSHRELKEDHTKLGFVYSYRGELTYYPFPFEMNVTFLMQYDQLAVNFKIKNTGEENLPFGFGWHPYFRFAEDVRQLRLKLPEIEQLLLDERQLPTGETKRITDYQSMRKLGDDVFDTGYRVATNDHTVEVEDDRGYRFIIHAVNQSYLQLFTPDDRRTIAIEPMSSGIDVFNSKEGLKVLSPGQEISFTTTIKSVKL